MKKQKYPDQSTQHRKLSRPLRGAAGVETVLLASLGELT